MTLKKPKPIPARHDAGQVHINGKPYHLFLLPRVLHRGEPVIGHVPEPGGNAGPPPFSWTV